MANNIFNDISKIENLVDNTVDSILSDITCREAFYSSNFNLSESFFKKLKKYKGNVNITLIETLKNTGIK